MTSLTSSLLRYPLAIALALLLSLVVADSPPASAADGEDASSSGDLDITDDLTITGAGEAVTIIDGGGIDRVFHVLSTATSVIISGATIQNGVVSPDDDGGGIRNQGTLTLANVTVSDNSARAGGGIFNDPNATLTLDDTTVTSNTATTTLPEFGEGGGIANRGTLTGTDVTVSDNTATSGFGSAGGGIWNVGDATLVNIALIRNTIFTPGGGGAEGGGLANGSGGPGETGDVMLTNATISGNSASNEGGFGVGGGINNQEVLVLNATTITSNTASDGGGFEGTFSGQLTLKNTIIANNSGGDCAPFSKLTSEGHNLDSDGSCQLNAAGDLPNADPKLAALADNGGPTQTHALLAGSPAIDAGDDTTCPASDQRGFPRPQGTACDIGAYEFEAPQPTPPPPAAQLPADFTVDSTADAQDASPGDGLCDDGAGNCTLRAAIQEANALAGANTITLPTGTYTLTTPTPSAAQLPAGGSEPASGGGSETLGVVIAAVAGLVLTGVTVALRRRRGQT